MSKQSKKRAKKRRKHRDKLSWVFTCPQCMREDDGSPGAMLTQLADALNAFADSGMKVKVRNGIVMAEGHGGGGYVLPLRDGRWTARDMIYDRFVQVSVLPDDMDD